MTFGNPTTRTGKVDTTASTTEYNTTARRNTLTPAGTRTEIDLYEMLRIRR